MAAVALDLGDEVGVGPGVAEDGELVLRPEHVVGRLRVALGGQFVAVAIRVERTYGLHSRRRGHAQVERVPGDVAASAAWSDLHDVASVAAIDIGAG